MSVLEFLRDRPIDVSIFGFSHLLQVTSDLGSNPGGSSWHVAFDVRGVRGGLMPVCGLQRVSHVFDSQTQVWLLPTKLISTSAPSEDRT